MRSAKADAGENHGAHPTAPSARRSTATGDHRAGLCCGHVAHVCTRAIHDGDFGPKGDHTALPVRESDHLNARRARYCCGCYHFGVTACPTHGPETNIQTSLPIVDQVRTTCNSMTNRVSEWGR